MNFIKKKINENKIKKVLGEFNESFQNSNYDECIKKIGILEDLGYSDIYYLKGIAFYVKGDYDESIDCLKKSNKYSKKDSFCQNLLIDNYVLLGKYLELDYTIKRLRNKISGMQELYFKINCLQHMKIDYFENNKEEISQLGTAIVIKKEDFNQQYQFFYEICHIFSNAIIAAGECINQCVHYCKQSSTQFKNFKIDNNIKHFIIEYDKWTHILSFSRNIGGILLNSKIKSYNYFVFYEEIWPNKLEKFYSGKYITQILNLIFQLNSPNLHIKIDKFDCICNILEAFLQIEPRAISQIINRDNIDMIFQITTTNELGDVTDYNQIKKSEYFNLLKYLIRNGYIDESYSDYMTYFYENSLTLNDKTFLRSVNDKKAKEYSYNLDSPLLVVSNLIPEDFLQEETLNFDLLEYLLGSENNKEYLGNLAIQLQEKMQLEFISQYFALNEKRVEFVRWLNKQWTGLFSYTYKGRKLSKEFLFLYSLYSVAYCSIDVLTEMNEEQVFSYFISNQEDFLIDSDCATDQMIDKLIDLDIKFETINPQSNTSLLTGVYENNLYVINATNIRLFLSFAYQIDEKIIQGHIMTVIMSKKDQPLCEYVCSNLNNTIEIINAMSTEGVDDDEEIILYILNSEQVNEETKEMYISLLKTVLHDLSKVMDANCRDDLLNRHLVDESAENICEYFSKQSLTEVLIRFINEISNELDFSLVDYDENIIQQFAECIQASNKIVDTHYRSIVSAQGKVLTDFSTMDLDESKVKILIDECKLQMNISNLRHLRQCYPDCVLHFIEKNLSEYCEMMAQKYIEIDEVEEILTWDILKIEDAKRLIDILPTTLKVIEHDYSDDIIVYILGKCFSEDEFIPLLEKFFLYSAKVQNAIIELSDSRMNKVVESMENIDFNILKKILTSDNIQHTNKVILLCEIIKKYKPDRIKEALIIAGYEEVSKLLDNKTRPRISANNEHKQLLNALKDNRFIISYEFNEKSGIYSYTRSTKKRNDLPPEFL